MMLFKLYRSHISIKISVILIILFSCVHYSFGKENAANEKKTILIITSYNPESGRIMDLTDKFRKKIEEKNYGYEIVIENMRCGSFNAVKQYIPNMNRILNKYRKNSPIAIIFFGQESWNTYLSIDEPLKDILIFSSATSIHGLDLKFHPSKDLDEYDLKSCNNITRAANIGANGGLLNFYDIEANIELISLLYPTTKNIAFLSDNSFGGVSLAIYFREFMAKRYPDLNLYSLDGRFENSEQLKKRVDELPEQTAVIIGTWRIDNEGRYILQSTLTDLFKNRPKIPIFSLTGLGIGSVAVGGFIPKYSISDENIINDIYNHYNIKGTVINTNIRNSEYIFDASMLKKYGISSYDLPKDSIIKDELSYRFNKLKDYFILLGAFAVISIIGIIILLVLYSQNKKMQRKLQEKESRLLKAIERAEESDKLKMAFLANMSHEIRTPLNSIVGFSELLQCADTEEEKRKYINIINQNNELLLRLIGDILDLSKIESGLIELQPYEFDFSMVMDDIISTLKQRLTNSNVEVISYCPYDRCIVCMDKDRVIQVLWNFINNSVKYTNNGYIKIGYEYVDNGLKLYVEDTGDGIATENHKYVFNRFAKFNSFVQGTGLGLAISKAIATALNGKIGFKSDINEGSLFWIWFPCEADIKIKEKMLIES